VELDSEILRVVQGLLAVGPPAADEWWQAGVDEALSDGALDSPSGWGPATRQGEATARPRRTPGAERA
jgi:hypothetical protein